MLHCLGMLLHHMHLWVHMRASCVAQGQSEPFERMMLPCCMRPSTDVKVFYGKLLYLTSTCMCSISLAHCEYGDIFLQCIAIGHCPCACNYKFSFRVGRMCERVHAILFLISAWYPCLWLPLTLIFLVSWLCRLHTLPHTNAHHLLTGGRICAISGRGTGSPPVTLSIGAHPDSCPP